jgi:PPOX class probable F420-dependent enzyme
MSVAERVSDVWNRLLGSIRHPDAGKLEAGARHDFEEFSGHKHCLVVTYRRSGEPVPTPVWFGIADGKLYFRSEERVGKIKRIRANNRVLVSPCDSRGKPRGEGVEAQARILPPEEGEHAEQAIQSNFGGGRRMYEAVAMKFGPEGVYVEVTAI